MIVGRYKKNFILYGSKHLRRYGRYGKQVLPEIKPHLAVFVEATNPST